MHKLTIAALLMVPVLAPLPAAAQVNDRVLMIFGNDPCPKDTICVRGSENDRYRIPKPLRNEGGVIAPANRSWAARAQSVTDAGARTGIGSCTTSGGGGWTGCYLQRMQAARAEAKANGEAAPEIKP